MCQEAVWPWGSEKEAILGVKKQKNKMWERQKRRIIRLYQLNCSGMTQRFRVEMPAGLLVLDTGSFVLKFWRVWREEAKTNDGCFLNEEIKFFSFFLKGGEMRRWEDVGTNKLTSCPTKGQTWRRSSSSGPGNAAVFQRKRRQRWSGR